jgi:Ca-activated chloride channel family protein
MAIIEQRLQQVEGDPTVLMRNQFKIEDMQYMRAAGGPLRESRPW